MARKIVLVLGLIAFAAVIYQWNQALESIPRVSERAPLTQRVMGENGYSRMEQVGTRQPIGTVTPAVAAEIRANINQQYGLWSVLVIAGTAGLFYVFRES